LTEAGTEGLRDCRDSGTKGTRERAGCGENGTGGDCGVGVFFLAIWAFQRSDPSLPPSAATFLPRDVNIAAVESRLASRT